jgi:acylphosphatase
VTGPPLRVRVVVRGLVQGVWFRESCRRRAIELGVDGWVRNRADGTVEAVMSGDEAAVAQLVAWCRAGPPRAEVTGVDVVEEEAPEGELPVGFRVR